MKKCVLVFQYDKLDVVFQIIKDEILFLLRITKTRNARKATREKNKSLVGAPLIVPHINFMIELMKLLTIFIRIH